MLANEHAKLPKFRDAASAEPATNMFISEKKIVSRNFPNSITSNPSGHGPVSVPNASPSKLRPHIPRNS